MRIADIHDLMVDQLRDLYSAERQLSQALPRMAVAAGSEELRATLLDRVALTKSHLARLEDVFRHLDVPVRAKHSRGMEGLLEEGKDLLTAKASATVRDTGLVASAQRTGYYEIASYGILAGMAEQTSNARVAELLRISLVEEQAMDARLHAVAEAVAGMHAREQHARWDGAERRRHHRQPVSYGIWGTITASN